MRGGPYAYRYPGSKPGACLTPPHLGQARRPVPTAKEGKNGAGMVCVQAFVDKIRADSKRGTRKEGPACS